MSAVAMETYITPEEYLSSERKAEIKSEYIQGEVFAMSGASNAHNLITLDIATELNVQLRGQGCLVYSNDMRVKTKSTESYLYPDVVVVCGKPLFEDNVFDTLLNPMVIFEVLSPSTEAYDRGEKFARYQEIPTLREYVLVAQDRRHVEHHRLTETHWIRKTYDTPDTILQLKSIDCELSLNDVYTRVPFQDLI